MDDATLRLTAFLTIFACMAVAQAVAPRRSLRFGYHRWPANLGIIVIDILIVRLLFPVGAVGAALWAETNGVGLLHQVELSATAEIVIAVILLDLIIYTQHLIFHAVPLLWRLHSVHHADRDIDVTTGLRFHPIEIVLSRLIKLSFVIALGAPATAVLIFEIMLNGMAMFNHANLRLPLALDRILRLVIVTPDMHCAHHSILREEHDSNYGFNLSIWDRIFRTYTAQPKGGHDGMTVGLQWQDDRPSKLGWSPMLPFRRK